MEALQELGDTFFNSNFFRLLIVSFLTVSFSLSSSSSDAAVTESSKRANAIYFII